MVISLGLLPPSRYYLHPPGHPLLSKQEMNLVIREDIKHAIDIGHLDCPLKGLSPKMDFYSKHFMLLTNVYGLTLDEQY